MRRLLAVVTLTAASLATGLGVTSSSVAALPGGFTDTQIPNPATNPLNSPTGIVPLAGNRAIITEKGGTVRILEPDGTISPNDAISLSVCTASEMGLLGAAVDPSFILNGFVYLYYTHNAGNCAVQAGRFNRVSRFQMSGDTIIPGSEVVLLDNIAAAGGNHDGGDLEVGQDGDLYVSIGDSGVNPRGANDTAAEDLSLLNGKILRITTSGTIPPDNPFVGDPNGAVCAFAGIAEPTSKKCLEVFDWGLRNPYRFAFDYNTGATRFYIDDVGQNTWEEVDQGGKGLNYGWNNREGVCDTGSTTSCPPTPPGFTDPLTVYGHTGGCAYITADAFVPNGVWPADYDGSYLFADGGCNKIWRMTAAGTVDYANPFAQASGVIVDMAFVVQGGDPSLFYVTNGSSQLHKITYDAPPAPTSSTLSYSPLATAKRVYDTRVDGAVAAGTIRGGTTRYVNLGINDPSVKAALVNVTMVGPAGPGFLTASAGRTEHPSTSNINAASGDIVANASIVPVDDTGNIVLYANVTTHAVVDVLGVFRTTTAAQSGGRFTSLSPTRLIDTRNTASASNSFTTSTAANITTVTAPVGGRFGVPNAVQAVALIVTGVSSSSSSAGFVTAYPTGGVVPSTSNLNVNGNGDIRPNLVIVPLGAGGAVNLELFNVGNVVVDVAGYFVDATTAAGLYHVIAPDRQADSRVPLGFATSFGVGATQTLNPGGAVPATAAAISQNVTMTNTLGGGFVTAYPSDQTLPLASNGNATAANQDRASLTLTKVGGGGAGAVAYFVSGGADLVVDITGYFD